MDRELYQKQYDFELEQRNSIASSTNIPIVSITVIGGALSTMVLSFPYSGGFGTIGFVVAAMLSVAAILIALFFVLRSLIGYTYAKIPSPTALAEHFRDLETWHRNNGETEEKASSLAKVDFSAYLDQRLAEASEKNSQNNIRRGNFVHDATVLVSAALAFLVVAAPMYVQAKASQTDTIYRVEMVNPITIIRGVETMAEKDTGGGNTGAQPTQAEQKTAAPIQTQPKPAGPPNTEFRSSVESVGRTLDSIRNGSSENGGKKE